MKLFYYVRSKHSERIEVNTDNNHNSETLYLVFFFWQMRLEILCKTFSQLLRFLSVLFN
jgi:hypothetical protein